jgi:hypothetical protein
VSFRIALDFDSLGKLKGLEKLEELEELESKAGVAAGSAGWMDGTKRWHLSPAISSSRREWRRGNWHGKAESPAGGIATGKRHLAGEAKNPVLSGKWGSSSSRGQLEFPGERWDGTNVGRSTSSGCAVASSSSRGLPSAVPDRGTSWRHIPLIIIIRRVPGPSHQHSFTCRRPLTCHIEIEPNCWLLLALTMI